MKGFLMKKLILLSILAVSLFADFCVLKRDYKWNTETYKVICVDGIKFLALKGCKKGGLASFPDGYNRCKCK